MGRHALGEIGRRLIGVCLHCNEPIEEAGRSVIHLNGQYRCGLNGHEAEPTTPDSLTAAEQKARDEGYDEGYREAEGEWEDKVDDAYDDGRHELARDILHLIEKNRADSQILSQIEELCLKY